MGIRFDKFELHINVIAGGFRCCQDSFSPPQLRVLCLFSSVNDVGAVIHDSYQPREFNKSFTVTLMTPRIKRYLVTFLSSSLCNRSVTPAPELNITLPVAPPSPLEPSLYLFLSVPFLGDRENCRNEPRKVLIVCSVRLDFVSCVTSDIVNRGSLSAELPALDMKAAFPLLSHQLLLMALALSFLAV